MMRVRRLHHTISVYSKQSHQTIYVKLKSWTDKHEWYQVMQSECWEDPQSDEGSMPTWKYMDLTS